MRGLTAVRSADVRVQKRVCVWVGGTLCVDLSPWCMQHKSVSSAHCSQAVCSFQALSIPTHTRAGGGREAESSSLSHPLSANQKARCGSVLQMLLEAHELYPEILKMCVCVYVYGAIKNLSISCPDCPHASH